MYKKFASGLMISINLITDGKFLLRSFTIGNQLCFSELVNNFVSATRVKVGRNIGLQ